MGLTDLAHYITYLDKNSLTLILEHGYAVTKVCFVSLLSLEQYVAFGQPSLHVVV